MVVAEAAAVAEIVKRDGRIVPFDADRIYNAIRLCLYGTDGAHDAGEIQILTDAVVRAVVARHADGWQPTVEGVQDIVEVVLQAHGYYVGAKRYILYREEHARLRAERPIPQEVVAAYARDDAYFPKNDPMSSLRRFQFLDKYARWNDQYGRRETWVETVDRLVDQLHRLVASHGAELPTEDYALIRRMVREQKVMPSMRMLAMAGPAFERDNTTQFNCTYVPVDCIDAFVEGMSLSMSGCGVGFSVERDYVEQFGRIKRQMSQHTADLWVVEDSAEGWCDALRFGLERWFDGGDVHFDMRLVRPRGAPLRTKGGRASGPEPLEKLLGFTRRRILSRQGSFLRTLDAHDIMCAVGSAAVSGGVRRTAMISLFDEDDQNMLTCKSGDFERENDQRWNANNSMVWTNVDSMEQAAFVNRFMEMVNSKRGEPGIFSRDAADRMMPERRERGHRMGSNPCGEVILRPHGMCNLSIAVAREGDTIDTLADKVRVATIIGTIQSLGTHFPNLRPIWKQNAEQERLLGVDITGQMDAEITRRRPQNRAVLDEMRGVAIRTNAEYADRLNINQSAAVTLNKPSGNSSQLLNCSSGIHARWAPYYIRNARVSAASPVAKMLRDSGVPLSPENGEEDPLNPKTWVVSFPVKSPDGAITRKDLTAIEQCEFWLDNKIHWTEHNPSVTITYQPHEIIGLMDWVWQHRDVIGGMAFLPADDADYAQLPYIEIDRAEYERRAAEFPEIDFVKVYRYESSDMTTASQELACMAGQCEV